MSKSVSESVKSDFFQKLDFVAYLKQSNQPKTGNTGKLFQTQIKVNEIITNLEAIFQVEPNKKLNKQTDWC